MKLSPDEIKLSILKCKLAPQLMGFPSESLNIFLNNEESIYLVGATSPIGLFIINRCVTNGISVSALYHRTLLDFVHPLLKWKSINNDKGNFGGPLDSNNGRVVAPLHQLKATEQVKNLIFTAPIWELPLYLKANKWPALSRLIAFSSSSITGKANTGNNLEKEVVAKLQRGEESVQDLCEKKKVIWTIFRPTLIYGAGLDKNVARVMSFIKRYRFFPLTSQGRGLRSPVHADDLALAALSALGESQTFNKIYYLTGGETFTYKEMVRRIFIYLNMRPLMINVSFLPWMLDWYGKIKGHPGTNGEMARRMSEDLVFDISAAKKDFNYSPRKFVLEEPIPFGRT